MEALTRCGSGTSCLGILLSIFMVPSVQAQFAGRQQDAVAHSLNFIVMAETPQMAKEVSEAAEKYRRDLAIYWFGSELPAWSQRCPVHVHADPRLGASGETSFMLMTGQAGNWTMHVQGTRQRILDSVLPHEITHTLFATHFAPLGKYVPRWADEGACTTVEHPEEKGKHEHYLLEFLRNGQGIPFARMFTMKKYPNPILPLYAQGHSTVQFLISQGGPQRFVAFLEQGMTTEDWESALREHYAYGTLGEFQSLWNEWVAAGRPEDMLAYAPRLRSTSDVPVTLAAADLGLSSGAVGIAYNGSMDSNQVVHGSTFSGKFQLPDDPASLAVVAGRNSYLESRGESQRTDNWYSRRQRESPSYPDSVPFQADQVGPSTTVASHVPLPNQVSEPSGMPIGNEIFGTLESIPLVPILR
ncbi:MAG: hypothetical protein KDB03_15275 [Planctomycetales bacterium]|nr:hypothetical protein [Planctomycetales bacterium]